MHTDFISAEQTRPLRHRILRPHQTLADCIYPGDEESLSYHIGGFKNDVLECVSSVFYQKEDRFDLFKGLDQYRLRGMATSAECRGEGLGRNVLKACLEECWKRGADVFWCNARTTAAGYYKKMGFSAHPEEFDLPGIGPHLMMYIKK